MKRIIAVSTLAVATLVGFSSAANAADATSNHTGTVAATCSVTTADVAFTTTNTTINTVAFPTALTSTGAFKTLCNNTSTVMTVDNFVGVTGTAFPVDATPVVKYTLTTAAVGVYAAGLLGESTIATPASVVSRTGATTHAYSATPSDLNVAVSVTPIGGKILQDGAYKVSLKATLTP